MDEEMSTTCEELVKQTEEKMLYKFLLILQESEDKADAESKIKALLNK